MSGLLAGLLVAAAAAAGIYAVAAAAASTLAASFVTAETTGETRIDGFATKAKRAAAEHRAARARCERLTGTDRFVCRSEARAEMKRAVLGGAGM